MRFLAAVLISAALVGSSAHHDGPHLFAEGGEGGEGHHGGRQRGKWMCNLVAFQNPGVSVDECMTILGDIRSTCESSMEEGSDRRAMRECVVDTVKEKFTFVSLREMPVEQRNTYITQECSYKNDDGTPMHGDVDECVSTFNGIVEKCIAEVAAANEGEGHTFGKCLRQSFRALHHPEGETGDDEEAPAHGSHHGRPGEQWRGGGRHHGGGRGHGRRHGGRHGHGQQEPQEPTQGEVHIFPGEEKPIDEQPAIEKPLFPVDDGTVSIFPGEEGPEEEASAAAAEEPVAEQPRHPHHGWRRHHATGSKDATTGDKVNSRFADRSRFRGAHGRNFVKRED